MGAGNKRDDAQRVDRIVGWTIDPAHGMNIQDAPHIIGASEFQRLENTRWQGKYLRPRGGQSQFYTADFPAPAGYFLWGAYGRVMQHGGIGGVGFTDDASGEVASGPLGGAGFGLFWV